MGRTWHSVTVELLGGRGEQLWPPPGRVFAVGPSHTFLDLANAINTAFARWDRGHLSMFDLPDGRLVTDPETIAELSGGPSSPIPDALDIGSAEVAGTLEPGAPFRYTFDLGDRWLHRCVIDPEQIDPVTELGIRPGQPLPFWGWGAIPDQYGRRWQDDDLQAPLPAAPALPDPMLSPGWPGQDALPLLDLREVGSAIARQDAPAYLEAVTGRGIDDALQQIAGGIPMALEHLRDDAEDLALVIHDRLMARQGPGDEILAEDLLARVRDQSLPGRELRIDLDMLASLLHSDPARYEGGYVDLQTGDTYPAEVLDPAMSGIELDIDEEPDRWLAVGPLGSHEGWNDMALFTDRQRDPDVRERLYRALTGRGAFRRFRDQVRHMGLMSAWNQFSTDREIGRAREFLAAEGIRVP